MNFAITLDKRFLKSSYAKRMLYDLWKLGAAFAFMLFAIYVFRDDPKFHGWAIFFISLIVIALSIFCAAWVHQSKQIETWAKRQGDKPVNYTLSKDFIESSSESGCTKLKWDVFVKLKISEIDVLLFYSRTAALTIPTHQISEEVLNYIKERFSSLRKPIENKNGG